ncbi:unnamed protein product [Closterium sp. NIES-64]|nr:unnamed protein product [Closterium sp. NIES-64]
MFPRVRPACPLVTHSPSPPCHPPVPSPSPPRPPPLPRRHPVASPSPPCRLPVATPSGGAGGVGVEAPLVEDTAALSRRSRPASPPGFPSVPQFPPRLSQRSAAAEPGGVRAGGTGGTKGVVGGGSGFWGGGAVGAGTPEPTSRTVPPDPCAASLTVGE